MLYNDLPVNDLLIIGRKADFPKGKLAFSIFLFSNFHHPLVKLKTEEIFETLVE